MIHGNTPLAHHLLELPIRNRIRYVPPHAPQDNFPLKLTTLEVDHAASPPPHDQWRSIAESPSCENLRQNLRLSFPPAHSAPSPPSLRSGTAALHPAVAVLGLSVYITLPGASRDTPASPGLHDHAWP